MSSVAAILPKSSIIPEISKALGHCMAHGGHRCDPDLLSDLPSAVDHLASFSSSQSLSTQTLIPAKDSMLNYERLFGLGSQPISLEIWSIKNGSLIPSKCRDHLDLKPCHHHHGCLCLLAHAFCRTMTVLKGILLIQVFPNLLGMVAIYVLIFQIGEIIPKLGLNTHAGLIMVYLGGSMGINIWLMKGFLDTIPRAIDEIRHGGRGLPFPDFHLPAPAAAASNPGDDRDLSFIGTYGDFILARILLNGCQQVHPDGRFADLHCRTVRSEMGCVCSRRLDGAIPIMIIYLAAPGPDHRRNDHRCSQGISAAIVHDLYFSGFGDSPV